MATPSGSVSSDSQIGYGLPAASSATASAMLSIPEFNGNRKEFNAFDFKLKAVCFDLNLETILLKPEEWSYSLSALQRRVGHLPLDTRSSDPAVMADLRALATEQQKSKTLTKLLVGKLSANVISTLQASIPSDEWFNPVAIYKFLRQQYAVSDEAKKVAENPETLVRSSTTVCLI